AWALSQYGFRAIIAPSFADIFYNNSFKNGLLPVILPEFTVDALFHEVNANNGYELTINLAEQKVIEPNGTVHDFEVPEFRKFCLLNGLDDIGITLQHKDEIEAFENRRLTDKPWLVKSIY
ncbi:3-isopropylmalate dehydratase small subunit, partial [Turicimonas muris]